MGATAALIVSTVASAGAAVATGVTAGAEALGISSGIATGIGTGVEGAIAGSGLGATASAITGHDVGKGALFGAFTGGAVGGLGGELGSLGLGTVGGDALAGGIGGELGGLATGQKGLAPALEGAAGGAISGVLSGAPTTAGTAGATGGGATSAAASAAPAGLGGAAPDLGIQPLTTPDFSSLPGSFTTNTGALPGSVGAGAAAGGELATPGLGSTALAGGAGTFNGPIGADGLPANAGAYGASTGGSFGAGSVGTVPSAGAASAGGGGLSLGKLLPLGILGADALLGNKKPAFEGQLQGIANQDAARGAQLQNYLNTGTLPPGIQGSLNAAQNDAAASIRSEYAARGGSGSSAEAQDVSNLAERTQAQGQQMAMQLFNSGVSETQAADQIYGQLMQVQLQQDNNLSSAVGKFASSLALMGSPIAASGS